MKEPLDVPADVAAKFVGGNRLPPLLSLEVLDVLEGFGSEFKGKTVAIMAGKFDSDLVGKTMALEVYQSPSTNFGTSYFFKNGFDYSRRVGALVEQHRLDRTHTPDRN